MLIGHARQATEAELLSQAIQLHEVRSPAYGIMQVAPWRQHPNLP